MKCHPAHQDLASGILDTEIRVRLELDSELTVRHSFELPNKIGKKFRDGFFPQLLRMFLAIWQLDMATGYGNWYTLTMATGTPYGNWYTLT